MELQFINPKVEICGISVKSSAKIPYHTDVCNIHNVSFQNKTIIVKNRTVITFIVRYLLCVFKYCYYRFSVKMSFHSLIVVFIN